MKIRWLLGTALLVSTSAWAEDMFVCNGVYKNRPCATSERSVRLGKLPPIPRYDTDGGPRAGLRLDGPTGAIEPGRAVVVPRGRIVSPSVETLDFGSLERRLDEFSDSVDSLAERHGGDRTQAMLNRFSARVNAECSRVSSVRDKTRHDSCDRMVDLIQLSQRRLTPYL